ELVLEDAGEQPLPHDVQRRAVERLAATPDPGVACRRVVRARDRETALLLEELADGVDELGGGHEHRPGLAVVEHEEGEGHAHLRAGQAHAGSRDHRLDHVLIEAPQGRAELRHGVRGRAKGRVAERSDAEDQPSFSYRCGSASTRSTTPVAASSRSRAPSAPTRSGSRASKHTVRPSATETRSVRGANVSISPSSPGAPVTRKTAAPTGNP